MKTHPITALILFLGLMGSALGSIPEGYELKWSDEFDYTGAPDPAKWTHEIGGGGWGNQELQTYTDELENSRVEDGKLIIEVRQKDVGGRTPLYTSARLVSREKGQWKYGRMEVRAKLPSETGTWSAIWMLAADTLWSDTYWPDNGEIDIIEHVGYEEDPLFKDVQNNPTLPNIHSTLHTYQRNHLGSGGMGDRTYVADASSAMHTYALNWTDGRIEFEIDGTVHFAVNREDIMPTRTPPERPWEYWPFDQRFFLIMNIAVGGSWGGHFNSTYYPSDSPYGTSGVDHEGTWPQRMEVDYVRYYGPSEVDSTPVPGKILPTELDADGGTRIQLSDHPEAEHNLAYIDAGDWMEFVVEAPSSGNYAITAAVATPESGSSLSLTVNETASTTGTLNVPATGDWQAWTNFAMGTVELQQGSNTLRVDTTTGEFNLAQLEVTWPEQAEWKGFPEFYPGLVDTGDWLGIINITYAPWVFIYEFGAYAYMPGSELPESQPADGWVYFLK